MAILQNGDYEERDALFEKFDLECSNAFVQSGDIKTPISIAKGVAIFDPSKDTQFSHVFKRADDVMYKNKKDIKSNR